MTAWSGLAPAEKKTCVVLCFGGFLSAFDHLTSSPNLLTRLWRIHRGGLGQNLQGIKVKGDGKVVKGSGAERGAEKQLGRVLLDIAKELERVRVGGGLAQDGARLQDDLVGAEVVALEKDELVFVRQVQRPLCVLHEAEVQGLDAGGGSIGAGVAGNEEFRAPEAGLDVVGTGSKDGLVATWPEIRVIGGVARTGERASGADLMVTSTGTVLTSNCAARQGTSEMLHLTQRGREDRSNEYCTGSSKKICSPATG